MRNRKHRTAVIALSAVALAVTATVVTATATASAPQPQTPPPHATPAIAVHCPVDLQMDLVVTPRAGEKEIRTAEQITADVSQEHLPSLRGLNIAVLRSQAYKLDRPHRQGWTVTHPTDRSRTIAAVYLMDNGDGLALDRATFCAN